jgi:ABC-type glycerol-3-phosphate transport system permease component
MLKKVVVILTMAFLILSIVSVFSKSFATSSQVAGQKILDSDQATELLEMKESARGELAEYIDKYGSTAYGLVAYILNMVRIYSIPFCFIGIAIGSIYQYVIGIRKLDIRDRGFYLIITFVTILAICQVLPLIFAIVVNGWRG